MADRFTVCCLLNTRAWEAPFTPGEGPDPRALPAGLAAAGMEVRARTLNRFPLNPLARRGTFWAGFDPLRVLRVLLFDRDADVVFSVGESNVALLLLLAPLFRFRVPVMLREVSGRGWAVRDRVTEFVLSRVARVDLLTPQQMGTVPAAAARLRAPPCRSGFAVDEGFFRPLRGAVPGGYVLSVGDDAGRDYPVLIEACRTLAVPLVLRTGSGPAVPPEMRGRTTVRGRLPWTELRALYASAAVVVVPIADVDHPSGITAIFEAMATGCAVVVSAVGSAGDVVEHGRTGLLVPPGDPAALREAIARAVADPALCSRLGAAARAEIEGRLSFRGYVARTEANLRATAAAAVNPA